MLVEEKYDDGFVSTSLGSDDEFEADAPQTITIYTPEDIPWHIRNFPSWCPVIHFSPIEDGLNKNSIFIANTLKLQFYGTIFLAIIDYIISITLVVINERSINILGSGFLIHWSMVVLTIYTFWVSYRFLVYDKIQLQRTAVFLYTLLACLTIVSSLLNSGPFHGWFAVQFGQENSALYDVIMISIAVQSLLWNILFLLTVFIVMNLFMSSNIPRRNKMLSYVAYSHQLA